MLAGGGGGNWPGRGGALTGRPYDFPSLRSPCHPPSPCTPGWLINTGGTFWPGTFDGEHTWASLGSKPLEAWSNMAEIRPSAPYEILIAAGIIETWSEAGPQRGEKHYTQGGPMGLQFDPLGFQKK